MNISILGCGWLGLPLAEKLLQQGHTIHGSTTTKEKLALLQEKSINPYLVRLNPDLEQKEDLSFWNSNLLVLNIPPGRSRENVVDFHTRQIQSVCRHLKSSPITKVVFVSSTSVYPKNPGVVSEEDSIPGKAGRASGNALLKAEEMLGKVESISLNILRFGGLYGYDRHPAKYLAGRRNLSKGNAPVNLIHRDDCICIIQHIIEKPFTEGVFNGVSEGHPPRKMYYKAAAKALGLDPPKFDDEEDDKSRNYKVVSNEKLKHTLNYTFKYPNPMNLEGLDSI